MSAGDREAEAQAKKADDSGSEEPKRWVPYILKHSWCGVLRAVELIIAVIAIGLIVGALQSPEVVHSNLRHIAVFYSTYSSFIIICGILIIARLFGESLEWRTSIGFSIVGVIMFTATAAVIFHDWHKSYYANMRPNKQAYDLLITSGVFAVINAAVFLIHAVLTFRKAADY